MKISRIKFKILDTYGKIRTILYDMPTQKKCDINIGDILLRRAEIGSGSIISVLRYLDIIDYCEKGKNSFDYHNATTMAWIGEESDNTGFINLIDSYKKKGYDKTSRLIVDKYCNLVNGTHRLGANLFFGVDNMSAIMLNRSSMLGVYQMSDVFLSKPLSSSIIQDALDTYNAIQQRLIEQGNTFCCILKGEFKRDDVSLASDLRLVVNVLKIITRNDEMLVQFSLNTPEYMVKRGELFSKRAAKIENLLETRKQLFRLNVSIKVSKSCKEGKEMWRSFHNTVLQS